jgi:hypothetical protein
MIPGNLTRMFWRRTEKVDHRSREAVEMGRVRLD